MVLDIIMIIFSCICIILTTGHLCCPDCMDCTDCIYDSSDDEIYSSEPGQKNLPEG